MGLNLYDYNSVLIVVGLFVCFVLAVEVGYRIANRFELLVTEKIQSQINAILASMLGILALMMGFIFSQSLGRYDARSEAVIDEANAIGTAYLRLDLTPMSIREPARTTMLEYLDLRVKAAGMSLQDPKEVIVIAAAEKKQAEIWGYATQAAEAGRDPLTASFITSVNDMIDSYGKRKAEVSRHVPQSVILLLMFTITMIGLVVGLASGAEGHRPSITAYALSVLIVLLVFLVIDLDRPRRGLIAVPHDSLVSLQESVRLGVNDLE